MAKGISLAACVVDVLDEFLKPRGFVRHGLLWRKDGQHAVIAIKLWEGDFHVFTLDMAVWFKSEGPVEPKEVKPDGKYHLCHDLSHQVGEHTALDLLSERQAFRMRRALEFPGEEYSGAATDFARTFIGSDDDYHKKILSYFEPLEPLTDAWRQAVVRETMTEFVLPWMDRVEAGDRSMLDERRAAWAAQEERVNQLHVAGFRAGMAAWRANAGGDENAAVQAVQKAVKETIGMGFSYDCAIAIAAASGRTLAEVKRLLDRSGVWRLQWDSGDDFFVETYRELPELTFTADDRITIKE